MRQLRLDGVDDIERGGLAGLQHGHQRGAPALQPRNVGLGRRAVAHVRDIAHEDHGAVGARDRQVVHLLDLLGTGIDADVVFEVADLLRAGRQDEILRGDRRDDIRSRQSLGAQRLRIQVDLHLPLLAAVGIGNGRAGNRWPAPCG